MAPWAALAATLLAAVHIFADRMRFLEGVPRSRWLSLAGGVSVAYVFVHLLPELAKASEVARQHSRIEEDFVYLLALLGLTAFYALERHTQQDRARQARKLGSEAAASTSAAKAEARHTSAFAFWISIGSFALYNLLIGYMLLHRLDRPRQGLATFTFAMFLHFVATDFSLREHHKDRYTCLGRWVLSAAILTGAALGTLTQLPDPALGCAMGFLGGGIVLNVLKEELPEARESRLWAFGLGAAGYAALLMLVGP